MKKWIIFAVLLLAVFACGLIPVTKSGSFKITASYYNIYRQIVSPKNWFSWQSELKQLSNRDAVKIDSNGAGFNISTPTLSFSVQNVGLGTFTVTEARAYGTYNFYCAFVPDTKTNETLVTVIDKTNLFGYLSDLILDGHKRSPFSGLKAHMEDPRQYYGFLIRKELTREKLIAVRMSVLKKGRVYQQSDSILHQLNEFISGNKLKIVAPLQVQFIALAKDSMQIMIGLPVDKKLKTPAGIEYMTMPKGSILVGYFKGIYKNKEKLYTAMRQYMRDNYIHPIIQPFERFENNKLPVSDSSMVNMRLVVPYM